MERFALVVLTAACTALTLPAGAGAQQEVQTGGWAVYVPVQGDAVVMAGRQGVNDRLKGVVIADDPSSPLHLLAQNCGGTNLYGPDGPEAAPVRTSGYCVGWDAEGDLWWMSYWNGPEGGQWTVVDGTGKFDGMEGGGTSELVHIEADGRFTIRWRGTLTMK